jgi:tRNA 2-thiouridine synthesizing protein A
MKTYELDARKLLCPMPVIKTQNKIKELSPEDILVVTCTDPGVIHDIPAWCRINGHEVLAIDEEDREIIVKIKVK